MIRIGIIICARYRDCGGGKCFRALRERHGGFSRYAADEPVEIIGYSSCGGCPGGNVEYVPAEFVKNGCDVVHLATGLVVGYPPCPYICQFKAFIETRYGLPVVIGTHPIPLKYMETHSKLSFWDEADMKVLADHLIVEPRNVMELYN
ncbi:CGGC domain-containing protein [bacterium]|nr:CGGC domain-containing protein [bacterium]